MYQTNNELTAKRNKSRLGRYEVRTLGKERLFWYAYYPRLGTAVEGYGGTEAEAKQMLTHHSDIFLLQLMAEGRCLRR